MQGKSKKNQKDIIQNLNIISIVAVVAIVGIVLSSQNVLASSGLVTLEKGQRRTLQPGTESMVNLFVESITDAEEGKKLIQWCVTMTANTQSVPSQTYSIKLTSTAPFVEIRSGAANPAEKVTIDPPDVHDEGVDNKEVRTKNPRRNEITATFITSTGKDGFCVRTKELPTKKGTMVALQVLRSDRTYSLYANGNSTAKCTPTVFPFKCPILNARADLGAPTSAISLIPSRTTNVKAGSSITVRWTNSNPVNSNDWITIMQVSTPDQGFVLQGETPTLRELTTNPINPWFYICKDPACAPLPTNGEKVLKAPSKNPDGSNITIPTTYELRYYENNGDVAKARSPPERRITVIPAGTKTPVTTPPSAPANLAASCGGPTSSPAPGVSEGIVLKLVWPASTGAKSYKIRIDDQNGDVPRSVNEGCQDFQTGDFCTSWGGGTSYDSFFAVPSHSYKAWVQACNSFGCSSPTEARTQNNLNQISCKFKFGGVTLTPSISQTGPAEQVNTITGKSFQVTFTVPQGITVGTDDIITFAKMPPSIDQYFPITHKANHPDDTASDSNGIVTKTIAQNKYGQGTVKQLPSTSTRTVTINAPIVPGEYKIRYYDDAGTGETLKTWETLSYFAGESTATITVS